MCCVAASCRRGAVEMPSSLLTAILGGRPAPLHADLETGACSSLGAWMGSWRNWGVRAHFGGFLCFVSADSLHQLPIFKMEGI